MSTINTAKDVASIFLDEFKRDNQLKSCKAIKSYFISKIRLLLHAQFPDTYFNETTQALTNILKLGVTNHRYPPTHLGALLDHAIEKECTHNKDTLRNMPASDYPKLIASYEATLDNEASTAVLVTNNRINNTKTENNTGLCF